jgi:transcriptional regulator GlxA family with amidase domain
VPSDCGLGLVPTHTFANRPPLDLLCVPGGSYGVVRAIGDCETIEFVRRQAGAAKYATSVCTGAFILGVAGLLKGRRATTHWAFTDLLPLVGATHEKARVVCDGNVITAGGVTSGIDFGLTVAAEIAGETTAQTIQLGIEYDAIALADVPPTISSFLQRIGRGNRQTDTCRSQVAMAAAFRVAEDAPGARGSRRRTASISRASPCATAS